MIMTYDPVPQDKKRRMKIGSAASSNSFMRNIRNPCTTDPENASRLPSLVSPLIFHEDEVQDVPGANEEETKLKTKPLAKVGQQWNRLENYLDRRAWAKYVGLTPNRFQLDHVHDSH